MNKRTAHSQRSKLVELWSVTERMIHFENRLRHKVKASEKRTLH